MFWPSSCSVGMETNGYDLGKRWWLLFCYIPSLKHSTWTWMLGILVSFWRARPIFRCYVSFRECHSGVGTASSIFHPANSACVDVSSEPLFFPLRSEGLRSDTLPKTNHDNGKSTMNEDVSPIEHGDFPACHVSFRTICPYLLVLDPGLLSDYNKQHGNKQPSVFRGYHPYFGGVQTSIFPWILGPRAPSIMESIRGFLILYLISLQMLAFFIHTWVTVSNRWQWQINGRLPPQKLDIDTKHSHIWK